MVILDHDIVNDHWPDWPIMVPNQSRTIVSSSVQAGPAAWWIVGYDDDDDSDDDNEDDDNDAVVVHR